MSTPARNSKCWYLCDRVATGIPARVPRNRGNVIEHSRWDPRTTTTTTTKTTAIIIIIIIVCKSATTTTTATAVAAALLHRHYGRVGGLSSHRQGYISSLHRYLD